MASARRFTAYDLGAMNRMMRAVVTEGTAKSAQFGDFDIAGKTGTSQDYRDAWFIGYYDLFGRRRLGRQ